MATENDWPTSRSTRLEIGEVHLAWAASWSGVGSQYDASGEMHDTELKLVAEQPTSERCVLPLPLK